ncbi:MAG: PssE/Cps14G family polysaccharide biosynthesis glycosyltransferase [Anaerorhabdus sp.]
MILVSLGTQDKMFNRLLEEMERLCKEKIVTDKVIVQSGYTEFSSHEMKIVDYFDQLEFEKLVQEADILITHGGVGTIMKALKYRKKVIGVPRLKEYGEHHNNHQREVLEELEKKGCLIYAREIQELENAIGLVNQFQPNDYPSNSADVIEVIRKFIQG